MTSGSATFIARSAEEADAFLAAKNLTLSARSTCRPCGAFATFRTFHAPSLYLSAIRYGASVEIAAPAERNDYGLSLPLEGRMEATGENGFEACTARRTVLGSPGAPQRSRFGARSRRLALSVKRDAVRRRVATMTGAPVTGEINFQSGLDLTEGAGRIVREAMLLFATQQERGLPTFDDPLRSVNFEETVLNMLLLHHPHSHSDLLSGRQQGPATRDVKRAVDFIEANLDQPLRLECIVAAAGVSGRALNAHFRDVTGLSPMAYLRRARLRAAQAALDRGEVATVTEAALRFGFLHFGRFSGAYLEAFGEAPSETLSRGRRRFSAENG